MAVHLLLLKLNKDEGTQTTSTERTSSMKKVTSFIDNINGRVGVPILLYFLGVPGVVVIFLWLFFFKGQ